MAKKGEIVKPFQCSCGQTNSKMFTGKMKSTCKKCHSKDIGRRLIEAREKAIEYKGGKCEHCGYNKYRGALEFHHRDSTIKEFGISSKRWGFKSLTKELDKCDLLCANCHREKHAL